MGCEHARKNGKGTVPALKPTTFMTNSPEIAQALDRRCKCNHAHTHLKGDRAAAAAIYPNKLCQTIVEAFKRELATRELGMTLVGT